MNEGGVPIVDTGAAGAGTQNTGRSSDSAIVFRAVGDICPGDTAILGLGVCSATRRHGVSFPFAGVASLLAGGDILVGNLEGMLSRRMDSVARPDRRFCGRPGLANELRRLGFTGLTVANNHVLEHGREYFEETVGLLRDAGLEVFGLRDPSGEYHCRPAIVEVRHRRVGILAYNWVSVDRFPEANGLIAQIDDSAVNYTWNRDAARDRSRRRSLDGCDTKVLSDIRRLRPQVDYLVLLPHWAYEYVHLPPYGCVLEGRTFIEAGADLVVGTHPHVIQGYERHPGGSVFFSTGNFLFDHFGRAPRPGMILTCHLGGASDGQFSADFTMQDSTYRIRQAASEEALELKAVFEASSGTIASPDRERALDDDRLYAAFEKKYRKGKVRAIWRDLRLSLTHPFVARTVAAKVGSLAGLILGRMRGEKVRW